MKKFWLILAMLFVMACNALFPTPTPTPTPTETITPSPLPTVNATVTYTPQADDPTPTLTAINFVAVDLMRSDGDFMKQLEGHARKAQELGLMPVAEFEATW